MPVLEQDMTMYEMIPSWSRSLVPFHSLSFTHSGFSTIARTQCKGQKSHNPHAVTIDKSLRFLLFLVANVGFNMKCCISDGDYLLSNSFMQLLIHKSTYYNMRFNAVS